MGLRVAAVFSLIVFIDELFEFIEFVRLDVLEFHAERLFIDPLHSGFLNRQRRFEPRNNQTNDNHLPRKDLQITLKSCPSKRKIERVALDFV
jgi:hypothetical protein